MRYDYRIDHSGNLIGLRVRGPLAPQMLKRSAAELFADPDYRPDLNLLLDLRDCPFSWSQRELERIVSAIEDAFARQIGLSAVVVPPRALERVENLGANGLERFRTAEYFASYDDAQRFLRSGSLRAERA